MTLHFWCFNQTSFTKSYDKYWACFHRQQTPLFNFKIKPIQLTNKDDTQHQQKPKRYNGHIFQIFCTQMHNCHKSDLLVVSKLIRTYFNDYSIFPGRGHNFYCSGTESSYPWSFATSVRAFLAWSVAFLQPEMIVCGWIFMPTSFSASWGKEIIDKSVIYAKLKLKETTVTLVNNGTS